MIAEFRNDEWAIAGTLKEPRAFLGAISDGDLTMILGGDIHYDCFWCEKPYTFVTGIFNHLK